MPRTSASETMLKTAERHVSVAECLVAQQQDRVFRLDLSNRPETTAKARALLTTLQTILTTARDHLVIERRKSVSGKS